MKAIVWVIFFISFAGFSQDSLLIRNHYLINLDIKGCSGEPDQMVCYESLIRKYESDLLHPKVNRVKTIKKLILLEIEVGGYAASRIDRVALLEHFNRAQDYLDSIRIYEKKDKDIHDIDVMLYGWHRNYCNYIYHTDSTAFFDCNCTRFFPEFDEVDTTVNIDPEVVKEEVAVTEKSNYGEFYNGDTLRLNRALVSDSNNIAYFKTIKYQLLEQLRRSKIPEIMLEMNYKAQDTLILNLKWNRTEHSIHKTCTIVQSDCPELLEQTYLIFFSEMRLPYYPPGDLDIYIPVVFKPEDVKYHNNMNRYVVAEDHYLIEYEVVQPIKLNGQ